MRTKQNFNQDWQDVRKFGKRPQTTHRVVRPSAYALLLNDAGKLAVVQSPGGFFLPGGGMEQGESPEETIMRETQEECGLRVRVGAFVNRAIQFVSSESSETCIEKRGYFFEAEVERELPVSVEPEHETHWILPERATRLLSHESQSWAILHWRERKETQER